jgi:hypothetical protein
MKLFTWDNLVLILTREAMVKLDCIRGGASTSYFGGSIRHRRIMLEGHRLSSFRRKLTTARETLDTDLEAYYSDLESQKQPSDFGYWPVSNEDKPCETIYEAFRVGAELVIQQYGVEVWRVLFDRFKQTHPERTSAYFLASLTEDTQKGLMGLNLSMISGLYARWKKSPYIAQVRETSKHWEADWSTMKYRSRLKALFDVNDGALDSPGSEIKWNNKGYRKLVRRLKTIVVDELGAKWGPRFMEVVYSCATRHLWMIPRYDLSQFAVISRPSENNAR